MLSMVALADPGSARIFRLDLANEPHFECCGFYIFYGNVLLLALNEGLGLVARTADAIVLLGAWQCWPLNSLNWLYFWQPWVVLTHDGSWLGRNLLVRARRSVNRTAPPHAEAVLFTAKLPSLLLTLRR